MMIFFHPLQETYIIHVFIHGKNSINIYELYEIYLLENIIDTLMYIFSAQRAANDTQFCHHTHHHIIRCTRYMS